MDISTENDIVDISLYLNRQDNIHRPKSLITALNKYDLYYHKMTMAQMGSTNLYSPIFLWYNMPLFRVRFDASYIKCFTLTVWEWIFTSDLTKFDRYEPFSHPWSCRNDERLFLSWKYGFYSWAFNLVILSGSLTIHCKRSFYISFPLMIWWSRIKINGRLPCRKDTKIMHLMNRIFSSSLDLIKACEAELGSACRSFIVIITGKISFESIWIFGISKSRGAVTNVTLWNVFFMLFCLLPKFAKYIAKTPFCLQKAMLIPVVLNFCI